ncbi:multiple RNA-binding domain-containing protein 1 [Nematocida homosporus]|uniref:multiple RNA-binding domain-containing protein 1 n=1 Tax=Nematocida homosporus TaxID=1912981 RepID=UPI00221F37DE|nr:multiple RNA-binding domain-containing protein 1 [Nematocida homosporus]KAI5184278.1 multiple RNA-binding domain-containing protein 1 [Nematocida homosporus]
MRVVVKNLPSLVTETEIRNHFSVKGPITDVRLLTSATGESRRVAFLGYKTEEISRESVVYYNKSYYKGHRLVMEPVLERRKLMEEDELRSKRRNRAMELSGVGIAEMKEIVQLISKKKEGSWENEVGLKEDDLKEGITEGSSQDKVEEVIQKYKLKVESEAKMKVLDTGEIFVTGLPYTATEEEVEVEFAKYGAVSEVYLKHKERENAWGEGETLNCGHALITYAFPQDAYALLGRELVFQGRNLTILPSRGKPKEEVSLKNRSNQSRGKYTALFFNFTAILGIAAKEKRVSKSEILRDKGVGIGGRIALLESELVERTKKFLEVEGIAEGCTCHKKGCTCMFISKKSLLIKNIPYNTTEVEIRKYFSTYIRAVFSPSKTLVVLEYATKSDAANELKKNNFAKIRDHPVYVEYLQVTQARYTRELAGTPPPTTTPDNSATLPPSTTTKPNQSGANHSIQHQKIILKNIPFQAGRPEVSEILDGLIGKEYKLRFPKKADGTHRGFCFVEPQNQEQVALLLSKIKHLHLYGRHIVAERANL